MYKTFNSSDKTYIRADVNKTFSLTQDSDGLQIVKFQSGSSNETTSSYYNSLNHYFYKIHNFGGNSTFTGTGAEYCYTSDHAIQPQHKNKFSTSGIVVSIPQKYFGNRIKENTVTITDSSQTDAIVLKDDGYGNLYASGNTLSQSNNSPSSSDNYIGNIFYDYGIITIDDVGSYKTGTSYQSMGNSININFDSVTTIHTLEYNCTLEPNEYNQTTNKTILQNTASVKYIYDERYEQSSSVVNWPQTEIASQFRRSDFTPYVTNIGLYNDDDELIMVARLPQPIQKLSQHPLTFKVQMDF